MVKNAIPAPFTDIKGLIIARVYETIDVITKDVEVFFIKPIHKHAPFV